MNKWNLGTREGRGRVVSIQRIEEKPLRFGGEA